MGFGAGDDGVEACEAVGAVVDVGAGGVEHLEVDGACLGDAVDGAEGPDADDFELALVENPVSHGNVCEWKTGVHLQSRT